jgi:hypothetical protein
MALQGKNILVEIAPLATPETAEPADAAFLSLKGLDTGFNVSGDREETDPEFGDVDSEWTKPSAVSTRGWAAPFSAYWKDGDPAFLAVEAAVMGQTRAGAAASNYLYIRIYPRGKVSGATVYKGVVTPDGWDNTFPRSGTLDHSTGFTGYGKPIITTYTPPA